MRASTFLKCAAAIFLLTDAASAIAAVEPFADWQIQNNKAKSGPEAIEYAGAIYSRDSGGNIKIILTCLDPAQAGSGYNSHSIRMTVLSMQDKLYLHKGTDGKLSYFYITKFDDNPSVSQEQLITSYTNVVFSEFAPDPEPWDNNPKIPTAAVAQLVSKYAPKMVKIGSVIGSTGDLTAHDKLFVELEFENGNDVFSVNLKNANVRKFIGDCTAMK